MQKNNYVFHKNDGSFSLMNPQNTSYLYFPLVNEAGMMSSITPLLNGDIKTGQNSFLMEPISAEGTHNMRSSRNFWAYIDGCGPWSAAGNSARQVADNFSGDKSAEVELKAGFLWHKITREDKGAGIKAEIINFVPTNNDKVELMRVKLTNISNSDLKITPTAAIPIYGRSADNIRDHRHVTSLLHRIITTCSGIEVKPALSFDERGHRVNHVKYSVNGVEDTGAKPVGFFPLIQDFIGEGGTLDWPEAIVRNSSDYLEAGISLEGLEAVGAIRFGDIILKPGDSKSYIISMAISDEEDGDFDFGKYDNDAKFDKYLLNNKLFWENKLSSIKFKSSNDKFDLWMKWVSIQPTLRKICGCSFMPHHDYGKGGRGWRDLWQDCLILSILDPDEARTQLLNNFAGVKIDGSNATIIGVKMGEFLADRNNIVRMWMDHGAWPFLTTKLYIDATGDFDFLFEKQTYFKDKQISLCTEIDYEWNKKDGNKQLDVEGDVYEGTILEHLLLQNLTPFFNVGEHNNIKIEDADWNDAFDMAKAKGESVAFSAFYAQNLKELSKLLEFLNKEKSISNIQLEENIIILIDSLTHKINYDSVEQKRDLLQKYLNTCTHKISGKKVNVPSNFLCNDLNEKADWLINHIREKEFIQSKEGFKWFNGYYDGHGNRVEGDAESGVRMTLTGQVFNIMGGIATDAQVSEVIASANKFLKDSKVGGYRLNTDFRELKTDMGRCFGFAFGHKENGSMFSHMAIMYCNALYKRNRVTEAYGIIENIFDHCIDFGKSKIYPAVPEYINNYGRGMYNYLTGSASWLLLTVLCDMYGIKGNNGDLVLEPKILARQFDANGMLSITTIFAGKNITVTYINSDRTEYNQYKIASVKIDDKEIHNISCDNSFKIPRNLIQNTPKDTIKIEVQLNRAEV